MQILGCELHKNAFIGGLRPDPATRWGAIALRRPLNRYKWEKREGRGRKGLIIVGREDNDVKAEKGGWEGEGAEGERIGKGEGGLDLDICRWSSSS